MPGINFPGAAERLISDKLGERPSLLDYGVADLRNLQDGVMSASSPTLRSASLPFSAASVGRVVCVNGAGPASAALISTIAAFVDEDEVELSDSASSTVIDANFVFGTDNTDPISLLKVACSSVGRRYSVPSGRFLTTTPLVLTGASIECAGEARDNVSSSVICYVGTDCAVKIEPETPGSYCYAANFRDLAIATFGGATAAIRAENLSQAIFTNVGINQLYGASTEVGIDLTNPVILNFTFPIIQNCQAALRVTSTGFPDSATNVVMIGGNIYENQTVFDLRANAVSLLFHGGIHFEHFNSLVKINRSVGAADLQVNSLTIQDCEITASTGGWTSKIFDVTVPAGQALIAATVRFLRNWVFFGDAVENPFYFDVDPTGDLVMDLHIDKNVFSNIDTSLCHVPSASASVYYGPNKMRFGSAFVPLSAGSSAALYMPVYSGADLSSNTAVIRSAGGRIAPIAGVDWFDDCLHIQRDPNATTGQFEIADAAYSRVMRFSVPTETYTAILKFAGALGALALNGFVTIGSDEQPPTTLYVHDNSTGGHTQLQIKGNAADGALNSILNILTSASAAALQVLGNGVVLFPQLTASRNARIGSGGDLTTGQVNLTDSNDVSVGGMTDGALVKVSSGVLASATAFTATRMVVTDGSGNLVAHTAQTASRPMATASDGLPTTTSYTDIYNNIKADIAADFISLTDLTTYYYSKSEVDTLLAAKTDDTVYSAHTHTIGDHTHGGVTTGGDSTASGGSGSTSGP